MLGLKLLVTGRGQGHFRALNQKPVCGIDGVEIEPLFQCPLDVIYAGKYPGAFSVTLG